MPQGVVKKSTRFTTTELHTRRNTPPKTQQQKPVCGDVIPTITAPHHAGAAQEGHRMRPAPGVTIHPPTHRSRPQGQENAHAPTPYTMQSPHVAYKPTGATQQPSRGNSRPDTGSPSQAGRERQGTGAGATVQCV